MFFDEWWRAVTGTAKIISGWYGRPVVVI